MVGTNEGALDSDGATEGIIDNEGGVLSLGAVELLGYLRHCFRLAGNEFDTVFEDGAAEVLHRLSDGIPRIANNLVESSLVSAFDKSSTASTLHRSSSSPAKNTGSISQLIHDQPMLLLPHRKQVRNRRLNESRHLKRKTGLPG